jgi:glycine betaine/proline transport system permease protein
MSEFLGFPRVPLDDWIQKFVDWFVLNYRWFFQLIRAPIEWTLDNLEAFLHSVPPVAVIGVLTVLGLIRGSAPFAAFTAASLVLIGVIGLWAEAMTTLAIIFTALAFAMVVGVPLGVVASRSDRAWMVIRPVLDVMQTTPSFVYLVPVVMLFGVGTVPGVIATIIFSLPPLIRLTNLGLRQVPDSVVEAGSAFGGTEWQMLRSIRIPLAMPSIMAGVNQTLLLAMVMSSITAMIGAKGLGLTVLRGIGRLDIGLAAIAGISLVLLAMVFDRITQSFGQSTRRALLPLFLGKWFAPRRSVSEQA